MEGNASVQRTELASGITLNYIPSDKFKVSTFTMYFIVPLRKETATLYALLPHVLDRGCSGFPTQMAICKRLEELYAASISYRVYKRGEWQILEFSLDVLDNAYIPDKTDVFGQAMALFRTLLTEPLWENGCFLPGYVESEKKNLKDRLRAKINHKTQYAIKRCCDHMFAEEAFGISASGEEEALDAITPASLTEAYFRLLREGRVEMMYVGSLPMSDAEHAARSIFANADRRYFAAALPQSPRAPKGDVRRVEESSEAVQGKLVLGFRTGRFSGEEEYAPMAFLMELLYNSPTSKLFMNVREKLSLCYYCSATVDGLKGVMIIHSGIENENKDRAESAILGELQALRNGDISETEWDYAHKSLETAYQSVSDSPSSLCAWYLTRVMRGDTHSPAEVRQRALACTRGDVASLAEEISLDTVYFLCGKGSAEEGDGDDDK